MIMCSLALVAAALVLTSTSAPAQVAVVAPGDIVVTEMAAGRVVAVGPDGQDRELATGLRSPRGVAVMLDGSVLVAEAGANRIVGIGGRFGTDGPKPVVSIPFPEGITVSPDGQVYATALQAGEMGRVDVDAGTYTPIARNLEGPGDVAVRGIAMFVTESGPGGRVVSRVAADGRKAVFATGFTQPIGLAFGPGASLFVADFAANRIMRLDAEGNATVFAEVQKPVHLAIEPWVAVEGQPFILSATSDEGVVRFDQNGQRVVEQVGVSTLTGTAGIATSPGSGPGGTPGPTVPTTLITPTTAVTPTTTGTTPSQAGPTDSAPATTRPPRTTTTLSEADGAPSSTSNGILLASIVIIALVVVGGIVFAVVQRPKSGDRSGFEERPLDTNTVALAFGSCAAEEVELAEAEGALSSLELQGESAEKRLTTATEEVVAARARLAEVRGSGPAAAARATGPAGAAPEPAASSTGLRLDDLQLSTAAGKAALDAFLKREIEADELEEMWRALGEDRAIEVVRSARPQTDPEHAGADGPVGAAASQQVAVEAEPTGEPDETAVAAAQLAEAEEDVAHAHAEIERLLEREATARERIVAARATLDACQERHRAELDAESAANAEAATLAAASARDLALADAAGPDERSGDTGALGPDPAVGTEARSVADGGQREDADAGGLRSTDPTRPDATIVPERPPLTADAATVASLRRPDPPAGAGHDPADPLDADAGPDAPPSSGAAADPPVSGVHRRDGLGRGLFDDHDDHDGDAPSPGSTFPASGPGASVAGDDDGSRPTPPAAGAAVDPGPVASRPAIGRDASDPGLTDLLSREPADPDAAVDPSIARLDELEFAWPASGFQKLITTPPASEPEPAPEPEPEDIDRGELPRDDLKFL